MSPVNSSQRVWWMRICTLLSFLLSLGWASSALAAVPMCGVHAQSIAAPPMGTPTSTDALNADSPCADSPPLRAAGVPNREAPEKLNLQELQVRALPLLPLLAPTPLSGRLCAATKEHELSATGFARSIFRPPRA